MLKILESAEFLTRPGKGGVKVGNNSKAKHGNNKLDRSRIGDNEVDDKVDDEDGKKG